MSTRSFVCLMVEPGVVVCSFCKTDGSPEWMGPILLEAYNSPEKIRELLGFGDIYHLSRSIEYSNFYGRDRGEQSQDNTEERYPLAELLSVDSGDDHEFVYVFDSGWLLYGLKDAQNRDLGWTEQIDLSWYLETMKTIAIDRRNGSPISLSEVLNKPFRDKDEVGVYHAGDLPTVVRKGGLKEYPFAQKIQILKAVSGCKQVEEEMSDREITEAQTTRISSTYIPVGKVGQLRLGEEIKIYYDNQWHEATVENVREDLAIASFLCDGFYRYAVITRTKIVVHTYGSLPKRYLRFLYSARIEKINPKPVPMTDGGSAQVYKLNDFAFYILKKGKRQEAEYKLVLCHKRSHELTPDSDLCGTVVPVEYNIEFDVSATKNTQGKIVWKNWFCLGKRMQDAEIAAFSVMQEIFRFSQLRNFEDNRALVASHLDAKASDVQAGRAFED